MKNMLEKLLKALYLILNIDSTLRAMKQLQLNKNFIKTIKVVTNNLIIF